MTEGLQRSFNGLDKQVPLYRQYHSLAPSFSPCPNEGHDGVGGGRGEPEIRAWENIDEGRTRTTMTATVLGKVRPTFD